MGSKGSKTSTSSQEQTWGPTPAVAQAYQSLLGRIQNVSNTPYQPYGGELVAPLNEQQQAAIGAINAAGGPNNPYLTQATQYGQQGAAPITSAQISGYLNPYTQQVVDATRANFADTNAQQQQQVVGNAASLGALGGNRVGVAQAELARQQRLAQDPVIANLYSQGYTQALGAAQADRAAAAQGAYTFGNLGQLALSGAGAQLQAGTLEQQIQQAQDQANYQKFAQAQAYPFQTAQWAAGLTTGVGSQLGGTSTGTSTTTQPGPSLGGQIFGGLTSGLGLLGQSGAFGAAGWLTPALAALKHGGRVEKAGGGGLSGISVPFVQAPEIVPYVAAPQAVPMQRPQMAMASGVSDKQDNSSGLINSAINAAKQIKEGWKSGPLSLDASGNGFTPTAMGETMPSAPLDILGPGPYATGGAVQPQSAGMGFDFGGLVDDAVYRPTGFVPIDRSPYRPDVNPVSPMPLALGTSAPIVAPTATTGGIAVPFADRAGAVQDAIKTGMFDPQGQNYTDFSPQPISTAAPQVPASVPLPPIRPVVDDVGQTAGIDTGVSPSGVTAYAPENSVASQATEAIPAAQQGDWASKVPWNAITAAGFGMLASQSPFAGVAIGEGGLQGLAAYTQQKKMEQDQADKAAARALQSRGIDLQAKRLQQAADEAAKRIDLQTQQLAESKRQHEAAESAPKVVGTSLVNPKTGQPIYTNTDALLDPETIKFMAQQYRAGDTSVLTNLGRGAQGAQNIVLLRREIQRQNAGEGLGGADQAVRNAEYFGTKAGQRTLGTKQANIELAATEFKQVLPVIQDASRAVNRTNYPDLNRIIQAGQEKTGDPNIVRFGGGVNTLINLYARAISPSGVPTVSDKDHAREILTKAWSQNQFDAAVGMMSQEIDAALRSPEKVRDEMRQRFLGGQKGTTQATQPTTSFTGRTATNPKTGEKLRETTDGKWVP